ncbi:hypothetical protein TSOC_005762 [Tetrabaena socialis]|uniref:Uncharacterized protein n=1 Tax=Tetrabaena socialis TaxID=47790 RepID=A0A2J8A5F4_9CHLO|nr:hypothetical protein TSOC_005762 [Tetrabaena socialis]|eukprot:PNH07735.1 hypothetical protein TSOC_005762 [Tetrabaena socialis]
MASLRRGRLTAYAYGRGTVTCATEGRLEHAYLHRDYVFPPLPPGLDLQVGLELQYEQHCSGGAPYAYNIQHGPAQPAHYQQAAQPLAGCPLSAVLGLGSAMHRPMVPQPPGGMSQATGGWPSGTAAGDAHTVIGVRLPPPRALASLPPLPSSPPARCSSTSASWVEAAGPGTKAWPQATQGAPLAGLDARFLGHDGPSKAGAGRVEPGNDGRLTHSRRDDRNSNGPAQVQHNDDRPAGNRCGIKVNNCRRAAVTAAAACVRLRRRSSAASGLPLPAWDGQRGPERKLLETSEPRPGSAAGDNSADASASRGAGMPASDGREHDSSPPAKAGAGDSSSTPSASSSPGASAGAGGSPAEGRPEAPAHRRTSFGGRTTSGGTHRGATAGGGGGRRLVSGYRSGAAASARRATGSKRGAAAAAAAEQLQQALSRVSLSDRPVQGAVCMRLFCGHCGKEQVWDVDATRAKPLADPSAPDGLKRTKDGSRVLYDARGSTCEHCGNMVLCNPLSAVCIYCDSVMQGFRPTYWKCSNTDGNGRRRVMTGAAAAVAAGSGKAGGRTATAAASSKAGAEDIPPAAGSPPAASSGAAKGEDPEPPAPCEYARTRELCADHDLRFGGRPRCRCPRLHGAIAGQVSGNKAGNLGWVMVH